MSKGLAEPIHGQRPEDIVGSVRKSAEPASVFREGSKHVCKVYIKGVSFVVTRWLAALY